MKHKRTIRIIAIAMMAAFIICSVSGCDLTKRTKYDVAITELVAVNSGSYTNELGTPDWFEIHNFTKAAVDISGWQVKNINDGSLTYTFPEGTILEADGYLVISCDKDAAGGEFVAPYNLSSVGFTLEVLNSEGETVQSVPTPALSQDIAYAMKSNGKFGFTAHPTPGKANDDKDIHDSIQQALGGTPIGDGLYISEVKRGTDDFIEVCNPTDKEIKLENFYLSDNAEKKAKWRFPESSLQPGAYAVVFLMGKEYTGSGVLEDDGSGILRFCADFELNSTENSAYLFNAYGDLKSELTFDVNMADNVSAIRVADGIRYTMEPTPGYANSENFFETVEWKAMDSGDPVRINEALLKNSFGITDSFGERSDWVEIYNSSSADVSLLGYYLSDDPTQPAQWAFPDVTIGAGEYMIIFCSGRDTDNNGELHTNFSLSTNDGGVYLSTYSGMKQDGLLFPEEISSDVSIGRGENGENVYYTQPTPGSANTTAAFSDPMSAAGFDPNYVYISETCSVNEPRSGLLDWVELYNGSGETITLTNWHISDDKNDFFVFDLSGITIPAGGYAVIPCSSSILDAAPNVAPFSISPAGETIYLTDGNGYVIDAFFTGTNKLGVTSGRLMGKPERVYFETATKGAKNPDTCYLSYAAAPSLSDTTMYHGSEFTLSISKTNIDGTIRYTLDGSKPTESSNEYTAAITVSENTVVRAAVFVDGMLPSDTVTMTYIFDEPHSIPVVTIAMEKGDFSEMYAVSKPFVPVVERECYMQFFETDGTLGVQSAAGVRVSGASTRAYPQKSLGIYFRSGYGRNEITYPFFGEDYYTTFYSLVLRNAGQDYGKARIRDSFASKAMIGLNLDTSESRFVAVYINGEYWGLYDLKENMNEDFLATHYGVDPDTANIVKRNTMELAGSNEDFLRVRAFAAHFDEFGGNSYVIPMTDERYEQFKEWVDVENIMDYLIARTYLSDFDMFNQKYWRTTDYAVKWRAIFFDSDFAMSSSSGNVLYHYFNVKGVPSANGSLSQMDIFCGLNSNDTWRHDFIVRYIYVMKYHLNAERLTALLDEMTTVMSTEMDRHIARWGKPGTRASWEAEIASLRQMLVDRPEIAASQLRYYYGLSLEQYAALEAEADAYYQQHGAPSHR